MRTTTRRLVRVGLCLAIASAVSLPAASADAAAGAHPLGKFFKASMHFTKSRYAPGDKALIVITLRNTGSTKLKHIGAACNRIDDPDELNNTGRGWGALAVQARGVTLGAHKSRTFHVSATVPAAAQRAGGVGVACDFGYKDVDSGYRPSAHDTAKVPGQFGVAAGEAIYYVHGHSGATTGLKNVRVVLVDSTRCPVYTRTVTTDAKGRFRITHVPAGSSYELYAYPPKGWKVLHGNPTNAEVFGKSKVRFIIDVAHGAGRKPALPTKCS